MQKEQAKHRRRFELIPHIKYRLVFDQIADAEDLE